ncbi:MAG: hypothetical protein QXE73_06510 [Candidatus Bathyarchaeia archaeon]|nr:DNA replication complex GINS family protein [Candidatus Bathyarchaeota archaeon]
MKMYDELFNFWKKEMESPELQPLPKDFYARLADYMRRIREERRLLDEESLRGKLIRFEEENVKRMIIDLVRARYMKILQIVEEDKVVPLSSMTEEEEILYSSLIASKKAFDHLLSDILLGQRPKVKQSKLRGLLVVRVLKDIPQIVGVDMKMYGPFRPEDIAVLPEENARALIKQGAAVEIDVET